MKIYISSSFRNIHLVNMLRINLEAEGHAILDWTIFAPPIQEDMPIHERRTLLNADVRGNIFAFCARSCASADLFIYQGHSGQDSGIELGIAYASGVFTIGLLGPFEEPGTMLHGAVNLWAKDARDLLSLVKSTAVTPTGVRCYADRSIPCM